MEKWKILRSVLRNIEESIVSKSQSFARVIADAMKKSKNKTARQHRKRESSAREIATRTPGGGYEPCIVSFIDVLGFRDLLTTRHAHDIRDILLKLRKFTTPDSEAPPRRMKDARLYSRTFVDSVSDAVIRVRVYNTQYRDGAFFHELLNLIHAQIQCVDSGVVIRGGIAIGNAHVGIDGKGPVFGPAMVRAYEVESTEAVHPRIVLDQNVYETFISDDRLHREGHSIGTEINYVKKFLRTDSDGLRFLDYLAGSESEFDHPGEYFNFLEKHAELIRDKLKTTKDNVRAKFEWLATYHNSVIKKIIVQFEKGKRSTEAFWEEFECEPIPVFKKMIVGL